MTTRYESSRGVYWVEHHDPDEHGLVRYRAGERSHATAAGYTPLDELEARIQRGDFQPDVNVKPMRKVTA